MITFRNSKIIYYGPHSCENCGATICKMGREWGGTAFTYPKGPIYPNTEWHPHVCDPNAVYLQNPRKDRVENNAPSLPPSKPIDDKPTCGLCGMPMPEGEEMFNYHGYSGPCPPTSAS